MTMALVAEAEVTRARTEISEAESLQLVRNLVRIAMFNISYIRGLFPETFYQEKFVPALDMKVKKLLPMDLESKRFIDWMEKGVFDALQKKYLKTLLLTICRGDDGPLVEEYMFSFNYAAKGTSEEINSMTIEGSSGKHLHTYTNKQMTPQQMKQSACKMVRTLVQLMLALDNVPKERTVFMTLHYHDGATPADYEPPFFASSTYEDPNLWTRAPLTMKVGNVNSRHHNLAIKMKSAFDPSRDEYDMVKNETCSGDQLVSSDDDSSTSSEVMEINTQLSAPCSQPSQPSQPSQQAPEGKEQLEVAFEGISLGNGFKKMQTTAKDNYNSDTDKTEDSEFEAESLRNVRIYLQTRRNNTVHMADIFEEFPQISKVLMGELVERLIENEVLIILKKDLFQIKKTQIERVQGSKSNDAQQHHGFQNKSLLKNAETNKIPKASKRLDDRLEADVMQQRLYEMALFHTLPCEHITIKQLKEALVSDGMVRRLINQMSQDGYIEELPKNHSKGRRGRQVFHTPEADKRLQELRALFSCKVLKDKPEPWGVLIRAHEQSKTLDELGCGRMLVLGSDATQQNQLIQQEYSANDRHAKAVLTFKEPQQAMQERAKEPVVAEQSGYPHVAPTTLLGMGKRRRVQDSDPPVDLNTDSQIKVVGRMVKTSKVKGPIYQPPFKRFRKV